MPTQYISNYVVTGRQHTTQFNQSVETPITANTTSIVGNSLFFGIGANKYNSLRQNLGLPVISDFSIYSLTVFLCSSINGATEQFVNVSSVKSYVLGNVSQGYVTKDITTILENYSTNDVLLENMSAVEIQKLKKSFVLIFRINLSGSPVNTQSLQTGDIVQQFDLMVDLNQPGPYEVNYENIDIISPNDFTDNERLQYYQKNINTICTENIRCFYPKNINDLQPIPLVVFARANAGIVEAHDTYFNLFASYGYFCIGIPLEVTSTNVIIFDEGIYDHSSNPWYFTGNEINTFFGTSDSSFQWGVMILGILDHIQKNTSKIAAGRFNNKIDFTKIISMGHSRGGGGAIALYDVLNQKNQPNSLIQHFNTNLTVSDVKVIVAFAPQYGSVLQSDGSIANISGPITNPSDTGSIVPPDGSIAYPQRYYTYQRGISLPQFSLLGQTGANKLKVDIDVPFLFVYPEFDDDTAEITPHLYRCVNIDNDMHILSKKRLIAMKKQPHNGISIPPINLPFFSSLISSPSRNWESTYGIIFNNLSSRVRFLANKCLEFVSENVYNHTLNNFITNTSDLSARERSLADCFLYTDQPLFSSIDTVIDDFSGEIFTTNFVGYTFGLPISKFLQTGLNAISEPGFTLGPELCAKGLLFVADRIERTETMTGFSFGAAPFNRICTANGRGFLTSFNQSQPSYFLNYDYTGSELNLTGVSFIQVDLAQIPGSTFNDENNVPLQFNVLLKDSSNNGATLGSFNYNYGVSDPSKYYIGGDTAWAISQLNSIKFRLQDFEMKNENLNLGAIRSLDLLFGSNHGTTLGTIYIDGIYTVNNL